MHAFLYMQVQVCSYLCVCQCGDISIGRLILLSLWVDFKGEEISSGFSRLVNSLSPESGVILTCVCVHASLPDSVFVCVCVFICIHWLQSPGVWLLKRHLLQDQFLHCTVSVWGKAFCVVRMVLVIYEWHVCICNWKHPVWNRHRWLITNNRTYITD